MDQFQINNNNDSKQPDGEQPVLSLDELMALDDYFKQREKIVKASAEAGFEAIKSGFSSLLPEGLHFMISPFLETLIEGIVGNVLSTVQDISIKTYGEAVEFMHSRMANKNNKAIEIIFFSGDYGHKPDGLDGMVIDIYSRVLAEKIAAQQRKQEQQKEDQQKIIENKIRATRRVPARR
jgi:hypothetical protein